MNLTTWSKKLTVTIVVLLLMMFNNKLQLGLTEEQIDNMMQLAMVYLGGQSVVDVGLALKGSKTK